MMTGVVRIGVCQWALPMEGPSACKLAASLGLEGIQLDMGSVERGLPLSKRFMQEAYLQAASDENISFSSLAITETDHYTMFAKRNLKESEVVRSGIWKMIDAAEAMSIPLVMVGSFMASEMRTREERTQAAEVIRGACDYAEDKGVTVATENTLSAAEIEEFFDEVNRPSLRLYFDSQNPYLNKGIKVPGMLESVINRVAEVHVKDGKGTDLSGALLGFGDTDFRGTMQVLRNHGYSGWINLENYYDRLPLSKTNDNSLELIKKDIEILKAEVYAG